MKKRTTITLGLIVLLSSVIVIKNWNCSSVPHLEGWYDPADEINIKGKNVSLFMVKKSGKWFINEQAYPGDADLIESLERKARDFKLLDLVSEKGYYDKYDLTEENGISVVVKGNGKVLRKILIGKSGSTNNHSYLKIDDRQEIFLASGILKSDFIRQVQDLRDKRIFDIRKEDVKLFSVITGGKNYNFQLIQNMGETDGKEKSEKPVQKWICKGYEKVKLNESAINSILALFSPLKASEFPESAEKKASGNSLCRVTVPYKDRKIELEIFSKKENNMNYAWSSESEYIFTLGSWQTEKLFIKNITSLAVK